MGGLTWRCIRFGIAGVAAVIAVGSSAGAIRMLPWFFSPEVPWQVTVPFARALLAAVCEVGLNVGLPLGFTIAAVVCVRRGEFRALSALGVSPKRLAGSIVLAAVLACAATAGVARQVDAGVGVPGRFANALVREGRAVCDGSLRTSWVPLADVTWLCFADNEARVVGPLPRTRNKAWFSAHSLTLSDDLSSVTLEDLAVGTRLTSQSLSLQLRVGVARINNLRAWGAPPIPNPDARLLGMALAALTLGVGLPWLVFCRRIASPLSGGVVAVAGGFGLFRVIQALDHSSAAVWAYLVLPVGVGLAVALLEVGWGVAVAGAHAARLRVEGGSGR